MTGPHRDAGAAGEQTEPAVLNAPLFRSLMERMQEGGRAVVLDLGPAQPATISLFNRFHCRLDIADIAEGLPLSGGDDPDETDAQAAALLPPRHDEPADLVLCWDLLNYMDPSALKAFMNCIAERGHPGTLAHALIAYSAPRMAATPNRYAPTDDFQLRVLPTSDQERDSPRYTPELLAQCMPRYFRERAMLLRNGMQEFLFRL